MASAGLYIRERKHSLILRGPSITPAVRVVPLRLPANPVRAIVDELLEHRTGMGELKYDGRTLFVYDPSSPLVLPWKLKSLIRSRTCSSGLACQRAWELFFAFFVLIRFGSRQVRKTRVWSKPRQRCSDLLEQMAHVFLGRVRILID